MASSSILFTVTVFIALVLVMGEATRPGATYGHHDHSRVNYTTVSGYFLQDDPATNATTFDYTQVNLGLINRTYETDRVADPRGEKTQWERFEYFVKYLNKNTPENVKYKVLYMGRHGEGYHNAAESYYGTAAWNCYWSLLDGNGTVTWADAHLTELGVRQALIAHTFWREALSSAVIPAPQTYYVSPLWRTLQTANYTFEGLKLPAERPFVPVIKELLREAIGLHTCDRRSTKNQIHDGFPRYPFEPGFAEDDPLWSANLRESSSAQVERLKALLDDVFTNDDSTWISFTSHSGSIGAILTTVGHRTFSLKTGSVIPVLVRAETFAGETPATSITPSTTAPTCTTDPTASVRRGSDS